MTGLAAVAADEPAVNVVRGTVTDRDRPVFVFPGQGGQWPGMAAQLLDTSPVFAARIAECESALTPFVDWSLSQVLRQDPHAPDLNRVDVVQPTLWAVMVSLAAVWEAVGVTPAAVVGHSQGEIAAAVVAGALSLTDAARIIALRSHALRTLSHTGGGMLAIADTPEAVTARLDHHTPHTTVAVINTTNSVVVSGPLPELHHLAQQYTHTTIRTRLLPVDYASHGPAVQPLHDQIHTDLTGITTQPTRPDITIWSTLTTNPITATDLTADYWWRNLRHPVHFHTTIAHLLTTGHHTYIEISPHPVLTTAIEHTADTTNTTCTTITTLHREHPDTTHLATNIAHAWTTGQPINWTHPPTPTTTLPTYPFHHHRYW
ncbi:acyltransferase domain-containing protein, partial [Micromonospora sp. DT31]|uniref:acyltransferase domain-containing protein n=1 Tax=Micromonospora sp. DT31 TaxID=3393434 RepID=UPI003CEB9FEC